MTTISTKPNDRRRGPSEKALPKQGPRWRPTRRARPVL